jgi:hypothetical protein
MPVVSKGWLLGALLAFSFSESARCAEAVMPGEIANRFFNIFLREGNLDAIDYFMGLSPVMKGNAEQLQQMRSLLANAVRVYGPPSAVEAVSVEDLAPSLQRRVYITKHTSRPLVWEMYFYKPKNDWVPDQLVFLDQYQLLESKK